MDAICCDRPGDCDHNSCLEVCCESIVGALRKAANRTIPKKRCKAAQKPCWDREVQQRQKEASKFYWKWKQEGKPRSGILFEEMKQSRQAFRRELKRIKKAGERQECETLLKKLDSANSNAFWRSLKKQRNTDNSYSGVQLGIAKTDDEIISYWKDHFYRLGNLHDPR